MRTVLGQHGRAPSRPSERDDAFLARFRLFSANTAELHRGSAAWIACSWATVLFSANTAELHRGTPTWTGV